MVDAAEINEIARALDDEPDTFVDDVQWIRRAD